MRKPQPAQLLLGLHLITCIFIFTFTPERIQESHKSNSLETALVSGLAYWQH
ncbi:hypothetical protein M405DRAFT_822035 [Rhizopogon salebrosus TDB-379]|nr:hypothetical protein M405DRAFT_822035 [Rhizopogon salebrosus TDB-379]